MDLAPIPIRVKGKVIEAENNKFGWVIWVEVDHEEVEDLIELDSRKGPDPILYDTREEAKVGIKEHSNNVLQAVVESVGVKNIVGFERRK